MTLRKTKGEDTDAAERRTTVLTKGEDADAAERRTTAQCFLDIWSEEQTLREKHKVFV